MTSEFDVFLSHNSRDKPAVREIAEALAERNIRAWLDEAELVPGRSWQDALEEIIRTVRSAAVLVGKDGLGPWEMPEMRACLDQIVQRQLPVIPVLLPGAPSQPELPLFLGNLTWVDLRDGITDAGLDRLVWGITGQKPQVEAVDEAAANVVLHFTVDETPEGATVELSIDGGAALRGAFELDLADSQVGREVAAIAANECGIDDIQDVGNELWTKLQAGDLGPAVADARDACVEREGVLQVRLRLPPSLEGLPWEGLYDFESLESELATSPVTAVVRVPHGRVPKARDRELAGPLRMLVVIPSGSGLHTGVEWEKIQQSVRAAGEQVRLESLESPVTPDHLGEALRGDWDIVHFIGHGRADAGGRVELRFNGEDGEDDWLPAQKLASMFLRSSVQLVVLNCCHAGAVEAKPMDAPGSLGTFLMKARVPAVVVMRYEIADSVAADFSRAFYHEMLQGVRPGRVDLATQEGRANLLRTYVDDRRVRSYITPILYLAEGREQLFDLAAEGRQDGGADLEGVIDPRIDEKLLYALASGRCLPILGAGILAAAADRGDAVAPDPSDLARRLGEASQFPDFERLISAAESSSTWISPVLLERICQHFACTHLAERAGLTEAIQKAYRDFDPPPVIDKIARWPSLGVVYANVDGLLERALFRHRGRNLRVVQTENVDAGATPGEGELVLLNLRGNYTSPQTMVLTESDEDQVLDRIDEIASFVEDLMNQVGGCTLLYLGVSPRDPLVRALSRRLLRRDVSRNRGTAYFVASVSTPADQAYWEEFAKLEWLELDAETLINGLSIAAARAEKEAS